MESSVGETRQSNRLYLTLPKGIYAALERWAKAEDNKPSPLAAYILEKEIRAAIENGKIPSATPANMKDLLNLLDEGKQPSGDLLVNLADDLDMDIQILKRICSRNQNLNSRKEKS